MFAVISQPKFALIASTTPLVVTALLGALISASAGARASDSSSSSTYICRPTAGGETSNAAITGAAGTALQCRLVSITLKMSDGSMRTIGRVSAKRKNGPDLSKALTPGQINDAWVKWTEAMFNVNRSP